MKTLQTCLWFNGQAEQAAKFYVSVFPGAKILKKVHWTESAAKSVGQRPGSVLFVTFKAAGYQFLALNAGPGAKHSQAVSFIVPCKTQKEIDRYWKALARGGKAIQCGWLQDKFGVTWQIVPDFFERMAAGDPKKYDRMLTAIGTMVKLDAKALQRAYDGK